MNKETILVVDDNASNLKLMKVLLEIEGYKVITAMNAEEVLSTLKSVIPQIIFMDIQLPDMNGLELTKKLKADPKYKDIIIIAVTAYAMKGDDEKVLSAGCNAYITKPIDITLLPKIVDNYLNNKDKEKV